MNIKQKIAYNMNVDMNVCFKFMNLKLVLQSNIAQDFLLSWSNNGKLKLYL